MGVFDLGDMFDFNGDGKTDAGEEFMAYMMFEEMQKENSEDDPNELCDNEEDDDYIPPVNLPAGSYSIDSVRSTESVSAIRTEPGTPKPISLEEYKRLRSGLIHASIAQIVVGLLLCLIPSVVIYVAFVTQDPKVGSSAIVLLLFGGGGIVVLCIIAKAFLSAVADNVAEIRKYRDQYELSLSSEEKDANRIRKKRARWIVVGVFGVIIVALILIAASRTSKTASVYHDAEELIAAGEYDEAKTLLESIRDKGYHDTESLIQLCTAHRQYDAGRAIDAYYTLKDVRFSYITQEQRSEINSFQQKLQSEYSAYIKDQADRAQAEYERKQNLPFPSVGQYVSKSQLDGMTWRGNDNKSFDVKTTIYLYINNGEQYKLWITDYNCIKQVVKLSGSSTGNTSGRPGSYSFDTGPSVDGYSDPEEFYYWNLDDFVDYEDAESYYYAHGGE